MQRYADRRHSANATSRRVCVIGSLGTAPTSSANHESTSIDAVRHRGLRDAKGKAGLPKLDGPLWHAYRRSWATSRKGLPVVDVAAAGGWSDVSTLLKCYQQADKETLLEVTSHSREIRDQAKTG